LVTGACGFVGRHLVDALVARGDEVTAVDVGDDAPRGDVRYERGDVRDAEAMERLCRGQEVVFHNASVVHTQRASAAVVWRVNYDGTLNVIEACKRGDVPRLVYVSSASVVYDGRDIEGVDESMAYASSSQAPYADSKIAAERDVLAQNGPALATCAIRPHIVFGRGDTRFLPAVIERARAGRLKYQVGRARKLSDFTYVDNLVEALLLADAKLAEGTSAGRAYFVTNGEPKPFFEFVGEVLARLELPPIRGAVPFWLAYAAATAAEGYNALRGRETAKENGLSRFAVRYMCTHHYFSIDRARRELGYAPSVNLDEGIRRTCEALQGV
jgi:sterol-4alpha-carboxylate 3-dehydrogenase (decarboxylating)